MQLDAALEVAGMDVWFTNLRTGGIGRIRRGGPISRLPEDATPTTSAEFMALVHEGDRDGLAARIDQATREGVYSAEFRIVLPDGEVRWVSSRGRCLYDPDGTPSAMTGVDLDITERKRDEEQRRAAEDRFRQLAESIQQVFWMTDARGAVLYVSPAFETIFGRSCESLIASPGVWMDAVHPDDRERVEQAAYARSRRDEFDEVYRIIRPDGAVRWIRDRAFHLYDDAGELYRLVGTAADITEQRQLEEQLQQAQKMEIVGPPRRRRRARLQQPADGDQRHGRSGAGRAGGRRSDPPRHHPDPPGRRARGRAHADSCWRSAAGRSSSPRSSTSTPSRPVCRT